MKTEMYRPFGFTMIEVIIVGAIIAVLAIAAVQIYSGYIRQSRQETVNSLAEAAAASANAWVRKTGSNLTSDDVDKLHLYFPEPDRFTVEINPDGTTNHGTVTITDTKDSDDPVSATKNY